MPMVVYILTKSGLITIRSLLTHLSNGEFCSGQYLADELGVSRTAVANHIAQLQQLGLDIYRVKGRGYCLARPLTLLDAAVINSVSGLKRPQVLVHEITDSTNSQLMHRLQSGTLSECGAVIVAEAQTAGRGRRGRQWFSPFGSNLYFSMYWRLEQGIQAAMGLSLVAGLAILRAFKQQFAIDAKIKWPNDIYINDKKVAGILVELSGQADAQCDAVIGIGINISMPSHADSSIDQAFTDLSSHSVAAIDRNQLVITLQQQLITMLSEFTRDGFTPFIEEFNQQNQFRDLKVALTGAVELVGICRGVDAQGALLLETEQGIKSYFGGEVSLRGSE